jgi:hypothetical protein
MLQPAENETPVLHPMVQYPSLTAAVIALNDEVTALQGAISQHLTSLALSYDADTASLRACFHKTVLRLRFLNGTLHTIRMAASPFVVLAIAPFWHLLLQFTVILLGSVPISSRPLDSQTPLRRFAATSN